VDYSQIPIYKKQVLTEAKYAFIVADAYHRETFYKIVIQGYRLVDKKELEDIDSYYIEVEKI